MTKQNFSLFFFADEFKWIYQVNFIYVQEIFTQMLESAEFHCLYYSPGTCTIRSYCQIFLISVNSLEHTYQQLKTAEVGAKYMDLTILSNQIGRALPSTGKTNFTEAKEMTEFLTVWKHKLNPQSYILTLICIKHISPFGVQLFSSSTEVINNPLKNNSQFPQSNLIVNLLPFQIKKSESLLTMCTQIFGNTQYQELSHTILLVRKYNTVSPNFCKKLTIIIFLWTILALKNKSIRSRVQDICNF